jgi:hypothetical protein
VGGDNDCTTIRVYLQTPEGTFAPGWEGPTPSSFDDNNLAVADVDADGDPDIMTGGASNRTLYRNNGDGTFQALDIDVVDYADTWGEWVYLCDLTGDGDPEYIQVWPHLSRLDIVIYRGIP